MNILLDKIKEVETGKSVEINSYVFDQEILENLIKDLSNISKLYPDEECQNFIQLYAVYNKQSSKHSLINYRNILTALIIGFGGGVFVSGIVTMIEQFIIRR